MKLRKILSLVMVAALLCTICFISGVSAEVPTEAVAVVKEEGNYLLNGSFELAESKSNGEAYGYKDYCANHGGTEVVADYWETFNWLNGDIASYTNVKMTHTTNAHTGDYALYWDIPAISGYAWSTVVYPTQLAVDTLPTGSYRLTAWVKGTNQASTITITDANGDTMSTTVAATNEWKQISIDGITSIGKAAVNKINKTGIVIKAVKDSENSYFIIDDIRLEAVEAEDIEYLTGGGLEEYNYNEGTGYTNKSPTKNNNYLFADGWRVITWADNKVSMDHTTDSHSGSRAVKINAQVGDGDAHFSPDKTSLNTAAITEGYYTFSAWVKSTNTKSSTVLAAKYIKKGASDYTSVSKTIPAGEEWHKVSLYDIYLTDGATNLAVFETTSYNLRVVVYADTVDSYVTIDDITLTKQEPFYNGGMEITGSGSNTVSNGQLNPNTILQGFTAQDWSSKKHTYDVVTDDVHGGNQALKITKNHATEGAFVYDRNNGNDIGAGTYKLSAWVKGNATGAWLKAYQATVDTPSTTALKNKLVLTDLSETEWKYYEYIFTINEGYMITKALENGQTVLYTNTGIGFGLGTGAVGEYAVFDDIKLEKINADINVAKASVLGIAPLKEGETKLTLPDAGGYYNVSIAETSNTDLIALDGTVAPTVHRTQVDVTLRITEKNNPESYVDLEPIGVVIPGTEQTAIDAVKYAIYLLPNNNDGNDLLPIHYQDAVDARQMYNSLTEAAKGFVSNYKVLDERDGVLNQYSAVMEDKASLKNSKLRIKSAYPTLQAEGYTVKEYGMLFIPSALAENEEITLETPNVAKSVMTILPGEADADFYSILNGSEAHPEVEILMRSYITYEYGEGETVTLYGRSSVVSSANALAQ